MKAELNRQVFTTSRELEYFSEAELVTQTGYEKENWWPGALVKELLDNSLDACEQAGAAPEIRVCAGTRELAVSDNGPGLPADVVTRILDFSTRTSDKAAYVSPTRGAQGNAMKTVLAIPYVLNEGSPATIVIEAQGVGHCITVSTDQIARRPQIEHARHEIVKKPGTSIRLAVNSARSKAEQQDRGFLQKLLFDYALFNPHATFTMSQEGNEYSFPPCVPDWRKWVPSDPTSPHWYNFERFENLVAAYLSVEYSGGRQLTVREFVSEFRGLSSTQKQKQVGKQADLERAFLRDLVGSNRQLNRPMLKRLLSALQHASAPVKPELLGILGEPHLRRRMQADGDEKNGFRYKRFTGETDFGLPYVVESAFAMTDCPLLRGVHVGLNWSVPLSDPLQNNEFAADGVAEWGLSALLSSKRISVDRDPICLVLHLICPKFSFLDRGKSSVSL